jgi:hypothetical protein
MLHGNYSVLLKGPGRFRGGSTVSDNRSNFNRAGANRNFWAGQATVPDIPGDPNTANVQSIPSGYSAPGAWVMSPKAGGIASRAIISGLGGQSFAGAMGLNAEADLDGLGLIATAPLQLIVSAVAALSGSGQIATAGLVGKLEAVAALAGTGSLSGAVGALAGIFADLDGDGALTSTLNALGYMEADVSPFTELSPESLAAAVWASIIESGLTAEAAMRLIAAATAGEVSGAATATVTIRNAVADDKNRIVATVDGDGNRTAITYDLTD